VPSELGGEQVGGLKGLGGLRGERWVDEARKNGEGMERSVQDVIVEKARKKSERCSGFWRCMGGGESERISEWSTIAEVERRQKWKKEEHRGSHRRD